MNKLKNIPKATLLIIMFLSMLNFNFVQGATEQNISSLWSNPNQTNKDSQYKLKLANILKSGVLQQVIGCTGVVDKVSTSMVKFVQSPAKQTAAKIEDIKKAKELLKDACSSTKAVATLAAGSISGTAVSDIVTPIKETISNMKIKNGKEFEKVCKEQVESTDPELLEKFAKSLKNQEEEKFKNQCLDGIAINLAKNQLTSMTHSAMNWINTGYGGNPFFVQNMNSVASNIEKNIIDSTTNILLSDGAYPYGRSFSESLITTRKANGTLLGGSIKYLATLESDLGNFINDPKSYYEDQEMIIDTRTALQRSQDARDAFSTDFSTGGWEGWLALTQHDQNNPLGFSLVTGQYISEKTTADLQQVKDELAQNNGFLNQRVCVEWQLYDRDGNPLQKTIPDDAYSYGKKEDVYSDHKSNTEPNYDKCTKWNTVTPGSIIKEKTTSYLNSPERQLELADTINESLNALFSVLISKLEQGGLAGLSDAVSEVDWTDNINTIDSNYETEESEYNLSGNYTNGVDLTKDLGNRYIHDQVYSLGNWNAKTNTITKNVNNPTQVGKSLYMNLPPSGYITNANGTKTLLTTNVYYTVTTAGKTKLIEDGYNLWEVGDRAFWDGNNWQNWKCGLTDKAQNKDTCPKQTSPIKEKGIIQIQKDYIVAAKDILSTLPNIMPKIGELDYCIPGPNPNYKINSADNQTAYLDWVSTFTTTPIGKTAGWSDFSIDVEGDETYENWHDLFKDTPNVWKYITKRGEENSSPTPGLLGGKIATGILYFKVPYLLGNTRTLITNCSKWQNFWDGVNCDNDRVENTENIMSLFQNYVNNNLFQNFYEVFDNQMNKLYFNKITSVYDETENSSVLKPNPSYIPIAEEALDLTSNIVTYSEDTDNAIQNYQELIKQTQINIAKLEPIRAEVSGIIKAAQERRDAELIKKINEEAENKCAQESKECLSGINVPSSISIDDRGEYCIAKRNQCLKDNKITQAQYQKKYASCFDEEDIHYYNESTLSMGSSDEERCFDKIDNDLDGLVDEKDGDCLNNNTTVTNGCMIDTIGNQTELSMDTDFSVTGVSCNKRQKTECEAEPYLDQLYTTANTGYTGGEERIIVQPYTCKWVN